MALADLITDYIGEGAAFEVAVANGDVVAQQRIKNELTQAWITEVYPSVKDRTGTGLQLDQTKAVVETVLDNVSWGDAKDDDESDFVIYPIQTRLIRRLNAYINVGAESLAKLRGEYPEANGVVDAALAIYPSTKIYVVVDGPAGYINAQATVLTHTGEDPVVVELIGVEDAEESYEIPYIHVHFEYLDAELDLTTAEFMDTITIGATVTDGVDNYEVTDIDYDAREVELTLATVPSTVTFETLQADYTLVP